MPQVLSRTPQGVTVQQDDGSVVFLPPDVADQLTGGGTPPFADSLEGAPAPQEAPQAAAPPVLPPPAVDQPPLPEQAPIAEPVSGQPGASGGARSVSPTPPGAAAPVVDAPPERPGIDPNAPALVRQAQAQAAGGAAAFDAAMVQDDLSRQAEAAAAPLDAERQQARAKEQAIQEATHAEVAAAVKAQAEYDVRAPRSSTASTVAKVIALALSGVGQALSRQSGPNPVVAILEAKATAEAQERMRRYAQLGDAVTQKRGEADELGKTIKSNEARFEAYKATELAKYYKEGERQTVIAGGTKEMWASTATAQETLGKHEETVEKAQELEYQHTQDAAKQKLAEQSARTAAYSAATARGSLNESIRENKANRDERALGRVQDQAFKLADDTRAIGQQARGTPSDQLALDKDTRERMVADPIIRKGRVGPDGNPDRTIRNADGSPYLAFKSTDADEVKVMMPMTIQAIESARQIKRLIRDYGGQTDTGKSAIWQEIQSLKATILDNNRLLTKGGALDKGAVEQGEKKLGGVDPTSFIHNASPGLDQLVRSLEDGINLKMKATGWNPRKGDRWTVPEEPSEPPSGGEIGRLAKLASSSSIEQDTRDFRQPPKEKQGASLETDSRIADYGLSAVTGTAQAKPRTQSAGAAIDQLVEAAVAGDEEARRALVELLGTSNSPYVRAKAIVSGIDLSQGGR